MSFCIVLLSVLTLFFQRDHLRRQYLKTTQLERHNAVLNNAAPDPWQYRVLSEYLVEGALVVARRLSPERAAIVGFEAFRVAQQIAILAVAYLYYRRLGMTDRDSLIGLAVLTWGTSHALSNSDLSFNTYTDLLLYLLGALAIVRQRTGWLLLLTVIGAFNRETIGLLPLLVMWPLFEGGRPTSCHVRIAAASLVGYGLVFYGLRAYFGVRESEWGWTPGLNALAMNLRDERSYYLLAATLSILPLITLLRLRVLPAPLKAFFWILVPAWFAIHSVAARVKETRLFLVPFAVVFIPGALAPAAPPRETDQPSS